MKAIISIFLCFAFWSGDFAKRDVRSFKANHPYVQYIGRVDSSTPERPKFWSSGAYVRIKFSGPKFEAIINDENRYGMVLNYLEVQVDHQPAYRIKLNGKTNKLTLASDLAKGNHTITICKNTEAENGYIEFAGFNCEEIMPPDRLPDRRMEFIGDSITCGFGADESEIKCDDKKGQWYDQHNAWFAYGPTTARSLNAQWHLSSVSGIGLMHSCCNKKILMPQVYDKINMASDSLRWDFAQYQPDVVTICLGQNDGVQDSTQFCSAYVNFAKTLRGYYPKAKLIMLSSPMADAKLKAALVKYITAVKIELNKAGDSNIGTYFFSKQSMKGCGSHPSLAEQKEIATELTAYVKQEMRW